MMEQRTAAMLDSSLLLEAAETVARVAGDVALRHFGTGLSVEQKADGSPVTIADRAAERAAREWLAANFPADGVLGEEWGEDGAGARVRWILDPIDGTKTFVRGVPLWGTLVALCEGDNVLAGCAYFPGVNELLVAAPGAGCWWNGSRASASSVSRLSEATVLTTDERFPERPDRAVGWRELAARAAVSRTWGDCFGYLLVATGRAEVMTDGVMAMWDSAPLLPIVEEAGGVFTDWDGRRTASGGSAVATNARIAREAREILATAETSDD
ncbi:MAG TPA: histidinol-phosphatase [Gemmatimonadales bacterium]|nr:histidinol-phosphatase [Gemmatimonadales bacterium]